MTRWLLDVNVLIAILDPKHAHHQLALEWFIRQGVHAWATCPFTESGVTRILSSPQYVNVRFSPRDAAEILLSLKNRFAATHQFWPASLSIHDDCFAIGRLTGSKQITDMYLLGLAAKYSGSLATLDQRLDWQTIRNQSPNIVTCLQPA